MKYLDEEGENEGEEIDVPAAHEYKRQEPPSAPGDKPKHHAPGNLPSSPLERGEMEIAKYPVGKGTYIRLIASGPITQKSIEKLAALLKINKDDFPETADESLSIDEHSDN